MAATTAEDIIEAINSLRFHDVPQLMTRFLSGGKEAISTEKSEAIYNRLWKILHLMTLQVDQVPESLLPAFLSSVTSCHASLRNGVTTADAMLRDILLKLIKKKYLTHLLPLARHLSSSLPPSTEGNKLSFSCYAALWNAVIKASNDPTTTFRVRLSALSFHVQCQPFTKFAEKLRISLQIFSDEIKKHPSLNVNIDDLSLFMEEIVGDYFHRHPEVLDLYVGLTLSYLRVVTGVVSNPKPIITQACTRDIGRYNAIFKGLTGIANNSEVIDLTSVEEVITEAPLIAQDFCSIALKLSKDWKILHCLSLMNIQAICPDDEKSLQQYLAAILLSLDRTLDCLKSQSELSEDDIKRLLEDAGNVCEKYERAVKGNRKESELLFKLANYSYKIGRWCYQQKHSSEAIPFFKIAYVAFSKAVACKGASGNAEKAFEALIDSQRRTERYQDAMATVVDGLHGNERLLVSLAKTWVQLKMKCSEDDPSLFRTLAESFMEKSPKTNLTKEEILLVELDAWNTAGASASPSIVLHLLDVLLSLPSTKASNKAFLLSEKAHRIIKTEKHKAEELLKESLKIIKQQTKKLKKTDKSWPTREDDAAMAHFSLYLAQHRSHKMNADFLGPLHDDSVKDLDTFEDCVTLAMETVAMGTLDKALELWEGCKQQSTASFRCISRSLETLTTLANVFAASGESLKMCRALQVVNSIAMATGYHDISLQCSVNLVRGMLSLNQPQVAMEMAETHSKDLKLSAEFSKKTLNIAALFIAKAEVHLMLRQSTEAAAIAETLTEFQESLQSSARTKEALLFESQYQLMMYQLRLLTANQNCSLDHMTWGMRSVFKVIVHLTSGDASSVSPAHWSSIHALLSSLLSVGDAFLLVGDAQMTRSCLVRGVRVSQAFGLSRRLAEFHLKLAELDLLCDRIGGSSAHLRRAEFILTSERTSLWKASSVEEEEEEEDFLLGSFSPRSHDDHPECIDGELATSPIFKNRSEIVFPSHWSEDCGNECTVCCDVMLQRLLVRLFALRIEIKQRERPVDMETEVKVIIERTAKVNKKVERFKLVETPRDCFQIEKLSLAVQQAFAALEMNNHRLYNVWLKMAQETSDVSTGGHLHAAEMRYLSAVVHLKWPPKEEDLSLVDSVAARIGLLTINLTSFQTPCVKRKLTSVRGKLKPQLKPLSESESETKLPLTESSNVVAPSAPKKRTRNPPKRTTAKRKAAPKTVYDYIPSDDDDITTKTRKRRTTRARKKSAELPRSADSDIPQMKPSRRFQKKSQPIDRPPEGDTVDPSPLLNEAYSLLRHHPTVPVFRLTCHALAVLNFDHTSIFGWEVAFLLAESQATTFRHSCLLNLRKRILKQADNADLVVMRDSLMFAQGSHHLRSQVESLPSDWTVIQVSIVQAVGQGHSHMFATRYQGQAEPLTVLLPHFSSNRGQKLLAEFQDIIAQNNQTLQLTDKHEWWSRRQKLDDRMKVLLDDMQSVWLGTWHGLFLGNPTDETDREKLRSSVEALSVLIPDLNPLIIQVLCNTAHTMSNVEVLSMLREALTDSLNSNEDLLMRFLSLLRDEMKTLNPEVVSRHPVFLILDNSVQHLPWESIPALREHAYFRSPSLHFLCAQHHFLLTSSVFKKGIDLQRTFYILDPESNLPNTKEKFIPLFKKQPGWSGLIGQIPQHADMAEAMSQHDLFLYLGHGSGSKFVAGKQDGLSQLTCRAAALLLGCSSGRLTAEGSLDAAGVMLTYLMAGCPCVMGNLWDVTDRDIDRFFEHLMATWQSGKGLFAELLSSRTACKLEQLIGAAPVVYGLPVSFM